MILLYIASYWLTMFIMSLIMHRYCDSKTITVEQVAIFFFLAPLFSVAGLVAVLLMGTHFLATKIGINLMNFRVMPGARIGPFVRWIGALIAWLPKLIGLDVKTMEEVAADEREQHSEEEVRDKKFAQYVSYASSYGNLGDDTENDTSYESISRQHSDPRTIH